MGYEDAKLNLRHTIVRSAIAYDVRGFETKRCVNPREAHHAGRRLYAAAHFDRGVEKPPVIRADFVRALTHRGVDQLPLSTPPRSML